MQAFSDMEAIASRLEAIATSNKKLVVTGSYYSTSVQQESLVFALWTIPTCKASLSKLPFHTRDLGSWGVHGSKHLPRPSVIRPNSKLIDSRLAELSLKNLYIALLYPFLTTYFLSFHGPSNSQCQNKLVSCINMVRKYLWDMKELHCFAPWS